MATPEELKLNLKKAKQDLREATEELNEAKIREKLYLERLDNWAEKNQQLNSKISNMTIDEVALMQKAKAEYVDSLLQSNMIHKHHDSSITQHALCKDRGADNSN